MKNVSRKIVYDCVKFTQKLIQTPSMPKQEAAIAAIVAAEMEAQGFDEVHIDAIGNVIGRVYGQDRSLPAIVLLTHLDHVDPGDPALWPTPPFAAEIVDGFIVGRGAVDIKGPLATHLFACAALLRAGRRPRRDVIVLPVVQEEIGGDGVLHWLKSVDYPVGLVMVGEPSGNKIALGHRGIRPIWVTFEGRSAHASAPQKAINPNFMLADLLTNLRKNADQLRAHPRLGATTVQPTIIEMDTTSHNVSPAWTRVYLDFRTAAETTTRLKKWVAAAASPHTPIIRDGFDAAAALADDDTPITGFDTDPDDAQVQNVISLIGAGLGVEPTLSHYEFATDGRYCNGLGAPIIGFAPGEENQAHIAGERIAIDQIQDALRAYANLLVNF